MLNTITLILDEWREGLNKMKTFKLKGLKIVSDKEKEIDTKVLTLIDGLVINREDDLGWLIEAYVDSSFHAYFKSIEEKQELIIQAKITREENDPAFFITEIIGINKINEDNINIIFQGNVVDHRKSRIEELLQEILEQGYQGASLLKKFKESI